MLPETRDLGVAEVGNTSISAVCRQASLTHEAISRRTPSANVGELLSPQQNTSRNIFDLASFSQFTRGARMHVSTHEAAAIYARAFRARFGQRASRLAQDRVAI